MLGYVGKAVMPLMAFLGVAATGLSILSGSIETDAVLALLIPLLINETICQNLKQSVSLC